MEEEIEKKKEKKKIRRLPCVMGRFLLLGPTNHLFFHRAAQLRSYADRLGPLARRAPAIMCSPLLASMWARLSVRGRALASSFAAREFLPVGPWRQGFFPLRTETTMRISWVWRAPNKPGRSSVL
jgi:hypothetical protein